jgi:hypothetical protein
MARLLIPKSSGRVHVNWCFIRARFDAYIVLNQLQVSRISSLHSGSIAHSAISPRTVCLDASGRLFLQVLPEHVSRQECLAFFGQAQFPVTFMHEAPDSSDCWLWSAPEILLGWNCDGGVDIWGLGLMIYWMAFGKVGLVNLF